MKKDIDPKILQKAQLWLEGNYDDETKEKVKDMIENDPHELIESFYQDLEFGTGGLRGIMGVGSNRLNKYTVGMATQGLANYLKLMFPDKEQIKMAIAHDSRNNSKYFTKIAADILSANNIKVYVFDDLRPTPELSYAIRHFNCQSGIVITASHNPKEYNGFKAYWDDGGQLIPPHDKNVIKEVQKITNIDDVKFDGDNSNIEIIGEEIDKIYLEEIKKQSLSGELIKKHNDLKIVYTPLHGTGVTLVPRILKEFGFKNIYSVPEQDVPDGNFPTAKSPNPEEPAALELAIKKATEVNANLVMATDPDGDRVGIAVKLPDNKFVLLNGNQTACLLMYYLMNKWNEDNKITGKEFIVKTIVTTELLKDIAIKNNVECYDVLTGFKWIADKIKEFEGTKIFITGGEESYGYMVGDFVRDKDAVASCAMIAETAAWAAEKGKTLYDLLIDIYLEFDHYKEKLHSVVRKGKSGAEEIQKMMADFRDNPGKQINNSDIVLTKDYLLQKEFNKETGEEKPIDLPQSNVLQFFLKDGSKISMRPSGTEPKIKFYFSVKDKLENKNDFAQNDEKLGKKIDDIIKSMGLG
ncbi:MAG: phospho-sugar mutase [Bacteroidales bacterium]|nr:phospho-sugar mutase [Bacteroidales bacterium]